MVTAKLPLTQQERARIHEAVAAAEQRTSAVFALVIVPVSDRYALFPAVWAAVLALVATGVAALLWPELGIRIGFAIDAAVFAILLIVLDWLPLRLRIVPNAVKHNLARRLAHREFAVRIVGATHHRNGVLFFVSLGERYVEVIADCNIHSRVAADTWDRLVADFVAAVKAGRLAQGFIAAVESCGDILETHYPEGAAGAIPEQSDWREGTAWPSSARRFNRPGSMSE